MPLKILVLLFTIFLTFNLSTSSQAQIVFLAEGYEAREINFPFDYANGDIKPDPLNPGFHLVVGGFFGAEAIYRVDLSDLDNITAELIANGSVDTTSDDLYDNGFGNITIFPLPNGDIIVADNDYGTDSALPGVLGEGFLLLQDLNEDGDFLDVGEVTFLRDADPFSFPDFTGAGGNIGPDGRIYITTNDGPLQSEVLAMTPDGADLVAFSTGLTFGAGVDFLADETAVIGNSDNFPATTGTITLAIDLNSDGVATGPGETTLLTNSIAPVSSVIVTADDQILAGVNLFLTSSEVVFVDRDTGDTTVLATFDPDATMFGNFATITGITGEGTFIPEENGGDRSSGIQRLFVADSNGVYVISPETSSSVPNWRMFD